MRWLALLLCLAAACKKGSSLTDDIAKKDKDDTAAPASDTDTPPPKPKHHKHGNNPNIPDDPDDQGSANPDTAGNTPVDAEAAAVEGLPDARSVGGTSEPAHRDAQGHPHGPGGGVYEGDGPTCDAAHDHCLRPDVWFQADNVISGKMFRALPVYEFEGKWLDWSAGREHTGKIFHTKVATVATLHPGDTVVFFNTPQPPQWTTVEYDALTSSNWEVGIVDSVSTSAKTFKVAGWDDNMSIDTGRVITERK